MSGAARAGPLLTSALVWPVFASRCLCGRPIALASPPLPCHPAPSAFFLGTALDVAASTPASAAAAALHSRATAAAAAQAAAAAAAAAKVAAESEAAAALAATLSRRGVTLGAPLYAAQTAAAVQVPRIDGGGGTDADGPLLWPLLIVYPAASDGDGGGVGSSVPQSDYLEAVAEDATVADILATILPGGEGDDSGAAALAWDTRRQHVTAAGVDALYRVGWTYPVGEGGGEAGDGGEGEGRLGSDRGDDLLGPWVRVPPGWTLRRLLGRQDYVVPLFPVLVVVPRGIRPR